MSTESKTSTWGALVATTETPLYYSVSTRIPPGYEWFETATDPGLLQPLSIEDRQLTAIEAHSGLPNADIGTFVGEYVISVDPYLHLPASIIDETRPSDQPLFSEQQQRILIQLASGEVTVFPKDQFPQHVVYYAIAEIRQKLASLAKKQMNGLDPLTIYRIGMKGQGFMLHKVFPVGRSVLVPQLMEAEYRNPIWHNASPHSALALPAQSKILYELAMTKAELKKDIISPLLTASEKKLLYLLATAPGSIAGLDYIEKATGWNIELIRTYKDHLAHKLGWVGIPGCQRTDEYFHLSIEPVDKGYRLGVVLEGLPEGWMKEYYSNR